MTTVPFFRRFFLIAALFATTLCTGLTSRAADPNVQEIHDVVYKKVGDREIKLNLFLPVKEGELVKGRPLLIYLDSGCWYSNGAGNGGIWRNIGALERGFAVASVSHRSISEAVFPAPMEDVRAAVRFLRKHAEEYGYDPNRFAVMGASSGGHLSLNLGISDEQSPWNVGDNLDVSGQVQCVVEYYGPADLKDALSRYPDQCIDCIYQAVGFLRTAGKSDDPEHEAFLKKAEACSPINYVDAKYAPTMILQGTVDPLVPLSQSALMFEKLRLNNVRTQLIVSDGGVHDPMTMGSPNFQIREIFEFLQWKNEL